MKMRVDFTSVFISAVLMFFFMIHVDSAAAQNTQIKICGKTSQSHPSQISRRSSYFTHKYACDGNQATKYRSKWNRNIGELNYHPWLEIDLGMVVKISDVSFEASNLAQTYVFISDAPFNFDDNTSLNDQLNLLVTDSSVFKHKISTHDGSTINLPVNTTGRFIRVQKYIAAVDRATILEIGEIEVNASDFSNLPEDTLIYSGILPTSSSQASKEVGAVFGSDRDSETGFQSAVEDYPWWQFDLGLSAQIPFVEIETLNDADITNFYVFSSSKSFSVSGDNFNQLQQLLSDPLVERVYIDTYAGQAIPIQKNARFIRVQKSQLSTSLKFNEFKLSAYNFSRIPKDEPTICAKDKSAIDSLDTFTYWNYDFIAQNGCDKSSTYYLSSTTINPSDWWQMDLGSVIDIPFLSVTNGDDRIGAKHWGINPESLRRYYDQQHERYVHVTMGGADIFVSVSPFEVSGDTESQYNQLINDPNVTHIKIPLYVADTAIPIQAKGRYIRLMKMRTGRSNLGLEEIVIPAYGDRNNEIIDSVQCVNSNKNMVGCIAIENEGIHRITYSGLLSRGIDIKGTPVSDIALTHQGKPVPIYVHAEDVVFGENSYIELVFESSEENFYFNTKVYQLWLDSNRALRVPIDDTSIPSGTLVDYFYKSYSFGGSSQLFTFEIDDQDDVIYSSDINSTINVAAYSGGGICIGDMINTTVSFTLTFNGEEINKPITDFLDNISCLFPSGKRRQVDLDFEVPSDKILSTENAISLVVNRPSKPPRPPRCDI